MARLSHPHVVAVYDLVEQDDQQYLVMEHVDGTNLSGYLRDEQRTRSELEARQAWTINGARLAVSAPWLVLLFMSSQPDVIGRYRSSAGVVVLAIGAVLCVGAYRIMMRIGRLPVERRILS